jgi:hypothetical protein
VLKPSLEEGGERHAGGFDVGALVQIGDQAGAFDLGLALAALEGMPALPALAGDRVGHVDDDGPVAGRTFA